jgi:hypothetical protein
MPVMPRNSAAISPHLGVDDIMIGGSRSLMDKTPLKGNKLLSPPPPNIFVQYQYNNYIYANDE